MDKKEKFSVVQAVVILVSLGLALLPGEAHAVPARPLRNAPPQIQQAYRQITAAFALYQQFFVVEDSSREPAILVNAHNPEEARKFLRRSFSNTLADAICSNYTRYDKEHELLYLIPGDGLPRLGLEEQGGIQYSSEADDLLVFQYLFEDCYQPEDAYLYSVKARLLEGQWIIEGLDLQQVRPGSWFSC